MKANLAAKDRIRGEITFLVEAVPLTPETESHSLLVRLQQLESEGLAEKDALKHIARESGQGKSDLYRELQRERAKGRPSGTRSPKRN